MLASIPASEIALLIVAMLVGGVLTGLLAGLFGVGGGGVIVPVLYEVFGALGVEDTLRMKLCVGTSLAIIIPTALASHRAHAAKGAVLPGVVKTWRLPAVAGILTGSAIAAFAAGWVLQAVFVAIISLLGIKSLIGRNDIRIADHLPGAATMRGFGFFIGLASSLVGISGGGLSTNILLLYGVPIHAAVATSAGIGVVIPIPGVIGYAIAGWPHLADLPPLSVGYISLIGIVCIAPVAALVAPVGARLAHRLSRRKLEIAFGVFLMLVASRFLVAIFYG